MRNIACIASLHLRDAARNKFFLGVVFFFCAYVFVCIFLGALSIGHTDKVLQDAGLAGIEVTSFIVVVFSFIMGWYRDKETRLIDVYSVDMGRPAYISSKIIGYSALVFLYIVFCASVYAVVLWYYHAFQYACIAAVYPIFLKMIIVICYSALFASLFASPVVALLSTVCVCAAGSYAWAAVKITAVYGQPWQEICIRVISSILPAMDTFDSTQAAVYGQALLPGYFFSLTVYALSYSVCVWILAAWIFNTRE